jgi:amidase
MPVAPHAAVIPGKYYHTGMSIRGGQCHEYTCRLTGSEGYTEAINLMNYSVAVIPVTKADKEIDIIDESQKPKDGNDQRNWEACKSRSSASTSTPTNRLDDPEIYDGRPAGLQIVARKFEEEKVLAIAKTVIAAMETVKTKVSMPRTNRKPRPSRI